MVEREHSHCIFSDSRVYRYVLRHGCETNPQHAGFVNFIMLNPSTADETKLDPTLRRCRGFTRAWGYGTFVVTNLFAFRATDPTDMQRALEPVGPDNDKYILQQASLAAIVVLAWGSHGAYRHRAREVLRYLRNLKHSDHIFHFGMTGTAQPKHPLYLSADAPLVVAFP